MFRYARVFLITGLTFIAARAHADTFEVQSITVRPEAPIEGIAFEITYVASGNGVMVTHVAVSGKVIKLEPEPTRLPWPANRVTVSVPGLPAGNYTIQISVENEFFGTKVFATKALAIMPMPVPTFGRSGTILLAASLAILGALSARRG